MAKNKTAETTGSVKDFINAVPDEQKRKDSFALIRKMQAITGSGPKMWGPSIIGFGSYHYKYASGHEGDAPRLGFSPRNAAISIYIYTDTAENKKLLKDLGKFKMGKVCIYIKKLSDINDAVWQKIAKNSYALYKRKYP
ncbi:MAG: DUF1801 domain-containing protein [Bacteroidia bacterium]